MAAIDKEALEAKIGPKADYYLRRFEQVDAGRKAGWNWPAFFLSTAWFSYRGMGGWAALNFIAPWVAAIVMFLSRGMFSPILVPIAYVVVFFVLVPVYADALYYRRIKKEVERTAAGSKPSSPTRPSLAVVVGLVSVALPALVVAVVLPAMYGNYTERAQVSEAISLMASAKTPVAEYFADKGKWPDNLKEVAENTSGRYTERVEITSGAGAASGALVMTATMKASGVRSALAGKTVQISSADGKYWTCKRGAVNGVEEKYLPAACR